MFGGRKSAPVPEGLLPHERHAFTLLEMATNPDATKARVAELVASRQEIEAARAEANDVLDNAAELRKGFEDEKKALLDQIETEQDELAERRRKIVADEAEISRQYEALNRNKVAFDNVKRDWNTKLEGERTVLQAREQEVATRERKAAATKAANARKLREIERKAEAIGVLTGGGNAKRS